MSIAAEPAALGAGLVPVGLEEVQARASLERRFDRKYILDGDALSRLVAALAGTHDVLEIDGRRAFRYVSQYFDSVELTCYHAHIQRRRRRFKARVREYADTGYHRVEVKLKGRRGFVVKRWTDEQADVETFARRTVAQEYGQEIGHLVPVIRVCFRRITLVSRTAAERVTIDFDLRFESEPQRAAGLLPEYTIVETKSGGRLGQADLALRRLGIRPVRISKYVTGVGLLSGRVPNDLRPAVRRYFRCD